MSVLILGLISLGISAAFVLSSFAWWVNFVPASSATTVDTEYRGFPFAFYTVVSGPIGITDFEYPTLAVDIILVFIVCLAILTFLRWRALRNSGRKKPLAGRLT